MPISQMGKLSLQITQPCGKMTKLLLCARGCSGHWGHIRGQDRGSQSSGDSHPQVEPGFLLLLIAARRRQGQVGIRLREGTLSGRLEAGSVALASDFAS